MRGYMPSGSESIATPFPPAQWPDWWPMERRWYPALTLGRPYRTALDPMLGSGAYGHPLAPRLLLRAAVGGGGGPPGGVAAAGVAGEAHRARHGYQPVLSRRWRDRAERVHPSSQPGRLRDLRVISRVAGRRSGTPGAQPRLT